LPSDPVFGAAWRYLSALRVFDAADEEDEERFEAVEARMHQAADDLWDCVPTTLPGLRKLLEVALDQIDWCSVAYPLAEAVETALRSPVLSGGDDV
jgi:hypothetical protein